MIKRRHDHARDPGIEVHQHFLQPQKVPGSLGWIHGQVGIRRLFERRVQRDRPHHQNDGDDHGGKKFHAQQKGPDMDFLLPAGAEGPALAMVGLGHRRIGFQFADQFIVGLGLLPRQINVENEQRNQPYDGHIVRRRTYLPKLPPIHKNSRACVGTGL